LDFSVQIIKHRRKQLLLLCIRMRWIRLSDAITSQVMIMSFDSPRFHKLLNPAQATMMGVTHLPINLLSLNYLSSPATASYPVTKHKCNGPFPRYSQYTSHVEYLYTSKGRPREDGYFESNLMTIRRRATGICHGIPATRAS
jgi:hypothetical protein